MKFDHCGWPSFDSSYEAKVDFRVEKGQHGINLTETLCNACGSHLGHVFKGKRRFSFYILESGIKAIIETL